MISVTAAKVEPSLTHIGNEKTSIVYDDDRTRATIISWTPPVLWHINVRRNSTLTCPRHITLPRCIDHAKLLAALCAVHAGRECAGCEGAGREVEPTGFEGAGRAEKQSLEKAIFSALFAPRSSSLSLRSTPAAKIGVAT